MPTAEYYSTHVPGDAAQANYFRLTPTSVVARPLDAAVTRYEYSAFGDLTRQRVHANTIVESQDTSSTRSEEHTSELQSLMRISYAVFCLKKKKLKQPKPNHRY